jgi:hypothetical protein
MLCRYEEAVERLPADARAAIDSSGDEDDESSLK